MSKIFFKTDGEHLYLYMTHQKGKENSYLCYDLHHCVEPYTGGIYQNMDLWRLYELYAYELRDGKMVQTIPYKLINGGEWECAIEIKDTRDFHGGIHGYEHHRSVSVKINGEDFPFPGTPYEGWIDTFDFEQKSLIVKQETADEPAANHYKRYHFEDGKITLHQEVEWLYECTINNQFLVMFPFRRTSDDTPEGEQISDRIEISNDPTVYDIGPVGHKTGVHPGGGKQNVTYAKIWGEELGVVGEIHADYDTSLSNCFFVQNNATYNKIYFSTARGHAVKPGDVYTMDSTYEVYRK